MIASPSRRTAALIAGAAALAVPAAAVAAPKPGAYRGASVNKEIFRYGDVEPRTDKGKVAFTVKGRNALRLRLSGQEFMCGSGPHEIDVAVAKIKLNGSGRGKSMFTDPNVGAFEVAIKVTATGRATGTVTPKGLCSGVVRFSAKRR